MNWQAGQPTGTVWASGCDFQNSDLANRQVSGPNCASTCASTSGCTHFTWTTYKNGTCYMKYGHVSQPDAHSTTDNTMICGILQCNIIIFFNSNLFSTNNYY